MEFLAVFIGDALGFRRVIGMFANVVGSGVVLEPPVTRGSKRIQALLLYVLAKPVCRGVMSFAVVSFDYVFLQEV